MKTDIQTGHVPLHCKTCSDFWRVGACLGWHVDPYLHSSKGGYIGDYIGDYYNGY